MSAIRTILDRMMSEPEFADIVFANAEQALAEYDLPAEVIEAFKGMSHADFEALVSHAPEERKSLATRHIPSGKLFVATDVGSF